MDGFQVVETIFGMGRRRWRRMRRTLFRHLMHDGHRELGRSTFVAGVARSGTTWLAEMLASQAPTRVMFEPFNAQAVDRFRGFPYFPYRRPTDEDPELAAFADAVFSGRLRDPRWVDRHADSLFPTYRVVKDVRVALFLRWLHERFPEVPMFFLVRHPCAVVASHLRLGWSVEEDLRSMLEQPALIEDHLQSEFDWLMSPRSPLEQITAVWCIQNLVALRQGAGSAITFVHFEHLVRDPHLVVPRVFEAIGREYDGSVYRAHGKRSATVMTGSPLLAANDPTSAWKAELGERRAERVLAIVERFGLGDLYDKRGRPTRSARNTTATVTASVNNVIR